MSKIQRQLATLFFFSVILILGFALDTKLITILVDGRLLQKGNPLLGISEGAVLKIACLIEVSAMALLFFARSVATRGWTTLWLCGSFAGFRLGLMAYPHASCSCFGRLSDWIGVDDLILDRIQLGCLAYMFAGAITAVVMDRRSRQSVSPTASPANPEEPVPAL
jgi:hypothetical protein